MIYAIVSDIQGNYARLERVLNCIKPSQQILCLGDIVQDGTSYDGSRCIDALRERKGIAVLGNHDIKALANGQNGNKLSPDNRSWLSDLPTQQFVDDFLLVHTPIPEMRIRTLDDALTVFLYSKPRAKVCFFGHSNVRKIFRFSDQKGVDEVTNGKTTYILNADMQYLINPGAVGLNELPCSYILFDSGKRTVEYKEAN